MINSFEETLIGSSLITTNFKNIKNGIHEFKSKQKHFYLAFILCIISLIRSPFLLYIYNQNSGLERTYQNVSKVSTDDQSPVTIKYEQYVAEFIFGDCFIKLGNSGAIIHIWWATYSLVGIIFRLVFLSSEYRDNHAIFTTFHPDNYSNLKLSSKNLQKLILHTKVLIFVHKTFFPVFTLAVASLHSIAIYYASADLINANFSLIKTCAIFTHWFISLLWASTWTYHTCIMFTMTFTTFYLSCAYVKLRYDQVNEMKEDPLRAQTLNESREKMWSFIREHRQTTNFLRNFNKSVKWILFCVVYIFDIALAFGFVVIITGDFTNIWIQGLMLAIGLQQMAFLTICPIIASGVDTAATKSYGTLRTVQVANGKYYDSNLNHQLNSLVEEMGCEQNRISFYCLDLFPFKSISTYEFIAATASMVILFIPMFD